MIGEEEGRAVDGQSCDNVGTLPEFPEQLSSECSFLKFDGGAPVGYGHQGRNPGSHNPLESEYDGLNKSFRKRVVLLIGYGRGPWYSTAIMGMPSLLRKVFLVDLLQGLKITFRYQDPKEIYTEQYPLERPQVAERYRGAPRLNVNHDTNETFIPMTGVWRCIWENETGAVETVDLNPLDVISFPPGAIRRFENVTSGDAGQEAILMFVIGGDGPKAEFTDQAMATLERAGVWPKKS